jgi:hypothetical protein
METKNGKLSIRKKKLSDLQTTIAEPKDWKRMKHGKAF